MHNVLTDKIRIMAATVISGEQTSVGTKSLLVDKVIK